MKISSPIRMNHQITEIESLKSLDLSNYPVDSVRKLIRDLGGFLTIKTTLHKGEIIIRARPNEKGERFTTRSQLSYKPSHLNTSFQRASTPNMTMFYGAIDTGTDNQLNLSRVTSTLESASILSNNSIDGEQTITISKWMVTHDIHLLTICHNKDFIPKNPETQKLFELYKKYLTPFPIEDQNRFKIITEYFANEFAKKEISNDYDYIISAIFTEFAIQLGINGVFYPSVKVDGKGFNVAIFPEIADNNLKLIAVSEGTIYKKGTNVIIDNDANCEVFDDTKAFTLKPISDKSHIGRAKIMEELNKP